MKLLHYLIPIFFAAGLSASAQNIQTIPLQGAALLPESCNINPINGDLYVGSSADGSIQKISKGVVSWFSAANANGMTAASGMMVDVKKSRLWVCNMDIKDAVTGAASVNVFDLKTKKLLHSFHVPHDGLPHSLNDIVLDKNGNAYVTDSYSPIIWHASSDLKDLKVFVTNPIFTLDPKSFNLNGIVFTPDGKYIIASVANISGQTNNGDGLLFRISPITKEIVKVNFKNNGGGDGIGFARDGALYTAMMRTGLSKVTFTNNYKDALAVIVSNSIAVKNAIKDAPTTARVFNNKLYVVNSQFNYAFKGMNNYGNPFQPFVVSVIPISLLK